MIGETTMSNNDKLEQFKSAIKGKSIEKAISIICPINAECKLFQLKILAKRNNHDLAILFRGIAEKIISGSTEDLQATIGNMLATKKSDLKVTVTKARYDGEVYTCMYIDFKKVIE